MGGTDLGPCPREFNSLWLHPVISPLRVPSTEEVLTPMPARKRPEKLEPTPPESDVSELQKPDQTESDFLGDLDRATTNRADERLAEVENPSRPD